MHTHMQKGIIIIIKDNEFIETIDVLIYVKFFVTRKKEKSLQSLKT